MMDFYQVAFCYIPQASNQGKLKAAGFPENTYVDALTSDTTCPCKCHLLLLHTKQLLTEDAWLVLWANVRVNLAYNDKER